MGWFNKIFRSGDEVITTLNQDIHQSLGGTGWTIFNNLNTLPTMSLSSVFACVELISNSVAELPVNVNTEQEGKTTTLPTHAIYDISVFKKSETIFSASDNFSAGNSSSSKQSINNSNFSLNLLNTSI